MGKEKLNRSDLNISVVYDSTRSRHFMFMEEDVMKTLNNCNVLSPPAEKKIVYSNRV